jgi:hypothetical protein
MKRVLTIAVAGLLLVGAAQAQTIFDKRDDLKSVRRYKNFLREKLGALYSPDKGVRRDTFKLLKNSADNLVRDGDTVFAFAPLGDFVMGVNAPRNVKPDDSLQGDALEVLRDYAKDPNQTLTARENAIAVLGQVAAEKLGDADWNKAAVKTLAAVADGKDFLLVHGAMVGLGKVAAKPGEDWRDLADLAAKAMVARLGDKDPMVQRAAFMECLHVMQKAGDFDDATERVWDKVTDDLDDIRSPALQDDVKARLSAVVAERADSVFRKQATSAKKALDNLAPVRKVAKDPLPDLLATVREEEDPVKLEAALAKIVEDTKTDRALQLYAFSSIGSVATQPEVSAYKLQQIGNAQLELTRRTGSPLMYFRTASTLLGLASIHRDSSKASVPIVALARLLAASDQPGLVLPVLDEVRDIALTDLPAWLDSRVIALLFLSAADSPVDATRQWAFANLAQVGTESRNWAMRYEVLTRMEQLAKLAKDAGIQAQAASWN